ncbi:MAG: hypothetical protein Q7U01_11290 [Pseudomonas sp.]|nr:hypothetical protein [Pseudomonas sp.]
MSGHVGLRDDARIGALLAAQIARLFSPSRAASAEQFQDWRKAQGRRG